VAGRPVLVTDGGTGQGRSAVAAVRSLAAGGFRPLVTVSGPRSLAASSRHCALAVRTPRADDAGFAARIEEVAFEHDAVVLPASDAALLALRHPVEHLVDKARLAEAAGGAGLATPPALSFESMAALTEAVAAGEVELPAVVKPLVSREPAALVRTPADAARLDRAGPVLAQPFLQGTMRAIGGVVDDGAVLGVVQQRYLRTWPIECGTASAAVTETVDEDRLRRLVALLGTHRGIFQAQFIGDVLLDVNPRVYGSMSLATAAGVNLPAIWCQALQGNRPATRRTARPGVRYRWLEGDLRHLVTRVRRREIGGRELAGAVMPHRASAHSVESLADPRPLVTRLLSAAGGRG